MFLGNENVEDPVGNNTSESKTQELPKSVVDTALTASFSKKPQMSAAQVRCLEIQAKQHEVEMEILDIKKSNLIIQHKRKMEVMNAEFEYWDSMTKSIKSTTEQQSRPNTRARK